MQAMFRPLVLQVADNPAVEQFFHTNRATRSLVERFVAGETLDLAIGQARTIARQGMGTTLDLLGENVTSEKEAREAIGRYITILRRMSESGLDPNISVKLTMLGLDIAESLAVEGMREILAFTRNVGGFVRVDMEGSAYTEQTIQIVDGLHREFPDEVGTVIQ
ncbi:MAG: proline dehydrogenase family protein, partial [Thermomicrobiales bacterium]